MTKAAALVAVELRENLEIRRDRSDLACGDRLRREPRRLFEAGVLQHRMVRSVVGLSPLLDSEWIADLVRHGLIAKSFVPSRRCGSCASSSRYRRKLVEGQAAERNRLLKLLETANIKLASVASDVFGVSGRAMLRALIAGETSAVAMADLARGPLRRKRADLILALDGRLEEHHRFLLAMQLRRLEAIEADIERRQHARPGACQNQIRGRHTPHMCLLSSDSDENITPFGAGTFYEGPRWHAR